MALVNCERDGAIAIVTLNRPEKKNALNLPMFVAIDECIRRLHRDRSLRAVVLTAEGEDFCTGLDVQSVMASPVSALRLLWKWVPGNANLAQRVSVGWRRLPVPVIAAIQGRCWGGGLQIALGADQRMVAPDASLSVMEARWGLIPDMGGTLALRELLSIEHAKQLAINGDTLSAEQAQQIGLVTSVADSPLDAAVKEAKRMVEYSPDAVAAVKRLYRKAWTPNERAILARESFYQWRILLGRNQRIKAANNRRDEPQAFVKRSRW